MAFASTTSTPPFLAGTLTTIDGTLVELSIDMTILRYPLPDKEQFIVPKLKNILHEIAGGANILDTAGDEFTITITPTTKAAHPAINDREVMYKSKKYTTLATGAATGPQGVMDLIDRGYITQGVVVTNTIYIQVTLDGAAQAFYFRIEFEWVKISFWEVAAQFFSQGIINS